MLAQIEKATLPAPVTQPALDTTELPMRVRSLDQNPNGILTVQTGNPLYQPENNNSKERANWTRVCGAVLYANNWSNGNDPIGVYSIPLDGSEFTPLCVASDLKANGGGFY